MVAGRLVTPVGALLLVIPMFLGSFSFGCASSGRDNSDPDEEDDKPDEGMPIEGDGGSPGTGGGEGLPPVERPTYSETSGGQDLPALDALEGTVTIVGSSAAVPVSNRSISGFRNPANDGSELVRCNYYPNGNAEHPYRHAEVLAGIQGFTYYQIQAQLFEFELGQELSLPLGPEDNLEDGSQKLIAFASLTHDAEDGAYRYWYAVDEFAYPPYGSTCSVFVSELSEHWFSGSISCQDLVAVPDSPDAPVTNAPYPTAQVSIGFDCPVEYRDTREVPYEPGVGGSCTGVADACVLMSYSECLLTPGCAPAGTCSGLSRACDQYIEFYSCESQSGCLWSGYECYGLPDSCFEFDGDDIGCLFHDGCDWRDGCDGTALECETLHSAASCEEHGCVWSE